jgi:serine protease Do
MLKIITMKKHFLISAGLASVLFLTQGNAFSQQAPKEAEDEKISGRDEIIIRPKNDKDGKITIEIKDGQTLLNGKPLSTFEDNNFSVEKRKTGEDEAVTVWSGSGFDNVGPEFNEEFHNRAMDGRERHEANRALLGVKTDKGTESGAVVKEVTKGSAAEKIGLKEGDIITRVDEIDINNPEDLVNAIHKYKPEAKAVITFKRDGKVQKQTATLGKLKEEINLRYNYNYRMPMEQSYNFRMPRMDVAPRVWGWNSAEPKIGIKAQDTEEGNGAKVLEIDDDSPADKAGLKQGDIITAFDGKPVTNAGELAEMAHAGKGKASFKLQYTREGKSYEVEVKSPHKLKTADL